MTSAIGKVIRQYRLDVPLATGALGQTLRAQHVATGEVVAVKLFHERLSADAAFADRFRPIVQAAADLRHPNILAIREFGEQDDQYFIITDFISTGSLRTLLSQRDTRLPLRRALELIRQSADAIAAAHARGILHRDLKPENFLVDEQGARDSVRVADFGLTRLAETGLTIDGSLAFGSLPYMAPEQLRGLPIDVRSDLYSLGVVLYEIATGFPPFQVKNLGEALSKHLTAKPPMPRLLQPGMPASLEQLILRALEKDPGNRIQSATEFASLIQNEIEKLPGSPLVVWRGPATPPPNERIVIGREGSVPVASIAPLPVVAAETKRFALRPVSPNVEDPTLPPSLEAAPDAARVVRQTNGDSRRIGVVPERETLTLVPGQLAVFTVTLTNNGRTVDAFSLGIRGVDESWAQMPSDPQRLNPGQRTVVPLKVLVPRVSTSRAGTYSVTIVARSRENPGEEGTAPTTWTVQPFADTLLALDPPKARAWKNGDFAVSITNGGNAAAKYTIECRDDEKTLKYRHRASDIALEPGVSLATPLVASGRLRPIGTADVRTFTVTAKSAMAGGVLEPAKSVVGQLVHRALIPMWLPPLLLAGGVAAFFFFNQQSKLTMTVVPQAIQVTRGSSSAPVVATLTNTKNEAVTSGPPVVWTSGDTTIATVSASGVVTGKRVGSAAVTVQAGKYNQIVQVAVTAAPLESVSVSPKRVTLAIGATTVLRATARDANGQALSANPIWLSSDPTVATVGGGRVTAKGPGSATITAQVDAKNATADILVPAPKVGDVAVKDVEDCIAYAPSSLQKPSKDKAGTGWRVTDGTAVIATLDRESEADQVIAQARRYKGHCYLGRANTRSNHSDYIIEYWTAPTNVPSAIPNEDCREYDRASLVIKDVGAAGFSLEDRNGRLSLADTKVDAQKAWDIARDHLAFCVIARNNTRPNHRDYLVQYWK